MAWAWEQDLLEALPGFPTPRQHRAVAGRHYLTKEEINALYFATHRMPPPKGWDEPFPIGRFWRCALVVFFNYGIDYAEFQVMRSTSIAMSRRSPCCRVFLAMDLPVCSALSGVSSQRDLRNRSSSSSGWKRKLPPDGGWSVSSAFSFSSKLVVT